ncbi:MAG: UbiA family prenyltransferase [Thermoplasmata archaeon]
MSGERRASARDYFQAIRPQNAMLTALALALPVMISHGGLDLFVLGAMVLGFLLNSAASIHNNITDFDYDMRVRYTSSRVVGTRVPMKHAKTMYAALLTACILLGIYLSRLDPWALLVLFVFVMGVVSAYNLFGKTHYVWGVCISIGIAGVVWYGAIIGGRFLEHLNCNLFIMAYLALQSGFMQNWEGGLKDVATDPSNMAAAMGVRIEGERLYISTLFKASVWLMKLVMTAILLYFVHITVGLTDPVWLLSPLAMAVILLNALSYPAALHLLSFKTFDRGAIIRAYGYHEALTWVALPAALYPVLGIWLTLFTALLPLVWYVVYNTAVHGSPLVPDI